MRSFVLSRARKAEYPGVYQELTELFGADVAGALSTRYGGCGRLYIPSRISKNHPLCELLGEAVARKLAAEFGGLSVEIPRDVASQKEQRNILIMTDRAKGMTQSQLARKYQLTTRTISKITNQFKP